MGDVGIALFLRKHLGRLPATLFFLSPISIIITGYHNQFDNLAILLMLCATDALERHDEKKRDVLFILFFTLSLVMKHIFAFFIAWIVFSKSLSTRQKILYTVIPIGCFCLSFLLYCGFD